MNRLQALKDKLARLLAEKECAIALNKTFNLDSLNKDITQLKTRITSVERQINN
jgi:hypothetical protein